MASITFDVSESDEAEKLLLKFPYDEALVEKIKSLPWSKTEYGYHKPDDKDSPLAGYVDESCWFIDRTTESIEVFESQVGVAVPSDYWPAEDSPNVEETSSVELTVQADGAEFVVSPVTDRVARVLDTEFSYKVPDAEHTNSYQSGQWDGKEHLFDTDTGTAPVGLLSQAEERLKAEGFDVSVSRQSKQTGDSITTSWKFPFKLRDYQRDAVRSVIANDGGILSLPTGTGKTITALRAVFELNRESLVLVHTKELLWQWAETIEETLDVSPGVIGDGEWSEGPVTVATIQSVMTRGVDELDREYGIVVFDECHQTSAAKQMHKLGLSLDAYYRIGLSATPWRRTEGAELKIEGAIGDVAHEVTASDMIESGYLANPVFETVDPSEFGMPNRAGQYADYQKAYRECIELDPARLRAVAASAMELADEGHKVLVNVNRIIQGELIAWLLNPAMSVDAIRAKIDNENDHRLRLFDEAVSQLEPLTTSNAVMVSGDTTNRKDTLTEFESGERDIIVSTLLEEGVDIPDISAIVLAHGTKSDLETIQTIGRALRPTGDFARIVDVADSGRYFRDAFRERMETMERYYDLDVELSPETTPVPAVESDGVDVNPIHSSATESRQEQLTSL